MAKGTKGIRRRGTDSHGKTVWEVNVQYTDPDTGKTERVYKTVHGTQREAEKKRSELLGELEEGLRAKDADKVTFEGYAWEWLEQRKAMGDLSSSTADSYATCIRSLSKYVGTMRLKAIKPATIKGMYADMRTKRKLSGKTVLLRHTVMGMIMKSAVNDDLLLRNPMERVEAPKAGKAQRGSLSQFDAHRLLTTLDDADAAVYSAEPGGEQADARRYYDASKLMAVRLGLATGARRGEVLALTWGDVDLESGMINICKSRNKNGEIVQPKTEAGIRIISIDGHTVEALARLKEWQRERLAAVCVILSDATPVVSGPTGDYPATETFSQWWRVWADTHGFYGLKFHELRHTQATMLLGNGADVKTVQTRLGHSKASVTLDIYAHAVRENDRKAADLMGKLLDSSGEAAGVISFKTA